MMSEQFEGQDWGAEPQIEYPHGKDHHQMSAAELDMIPNHLSGLPTAPGPRGQALAAWEFWKRAGGRLPVPRLDVYGSSGAR